MSRPIRLLAAAACSLSFACLGVDGPVTLKLEPLDISRFDSPIALRIELRLNDDLRQRTFDDKFTELGVVKVGEAIAANAEHVSRQAAQRALFESQVVRLQERAAMNVGRGDDDGERRISTTAPTSCRSCYGRATKTVARSPPTNCATSS